MEISASDVSKLRAKTGAGIMDCKAALKGTGGDFEKAVVYLRKMGVKAAEKRVGRQASEGLVDAYIHPGGRVGVLLEVNCETDFVARTEDFKGLVRGLAMQIAAMSPEFVKKDDIPPERMEAEKEIFRSQLKKQGKPDHILDKIIEGKLGKLYEEICLLNQPFVKEQKTPVEDVVKEVAGKLGENIIVARFQRFELGRGEESGEQTAEEAAHAESPEDSR